MIEKYEQLQREAIDKFNEFSTSDMEEFFNFGDLDITELDDDELGEYRTEMCQNFINNCDLLEQCEIVDSILKKYKQNEE